MITVADPAAQASIALAEARPAAQTPARKHAIGKTHRKHAKESSKERVSRVSREARLAIIRTAQVWSPTNVPATDLLAGPQRSDSYQPNRLVTCDHVNRKLPGTSLKFDCRVASGKVVKVRYGQVNGKVQGEILATRLLWALGFGADAVYPVRVRCRGCSRDPWRDRETIPGAVQVFDPAAIELKPEGDELLSEGHVGWGWAELNLVDEADGGAPKAQRDALTLLAIFMQHSDTKPEQQRLLCPPGGRNERGFCANPLMMLHDVGLTFGHANYVNRTVTASVNFEQWSTTPVWRDESGCRGHLSKSMTGTLGDNPPISEAGRQFLAGLLVQLTDRQLHDLFQVAGVDRRSRRPNSAQPPASIDEWVDAFKHKRDEIVNARCPH